MTRAKDRLFLSYAEKGRASGWRKLVESAIPQMTASDQVIHPPATAAIADADRELWREVDPPVLTGQYDSSAAVTSITTFQACPRKYHLNSISPESFRGDGPGGIATGLAIHRILAGEPATSSEHAELSERFTASELGQRAARASRIEREFDFLFYVEDVVLRGQIDLWFEEAGDLTLVDYKTDRDETSSDAYSLQLRLYALALERYAGRLPDRAVLFYLRPNKAIEVKIDDENLQQAREIVKLFKDAQEMSNFPLRPGIQCQRCPFFGNRCPAENSKSERSF
jgi:ATP-dependent exoDNAse (exonuclease V) beta subunit